MRMSLPLLLILHKRNLHNLYNGDEDSAEQKVTKCHVLREVRTPFDVVKLDTTPLI